MIKCPTVICLAIWGKKRFFFGTRQKNVLHKQIQVSGPTVLFLGVFVPLRETFLGKK